jgi:hypothetical protein
MRRRAVRVRKPPPEMLGPGVPEKVGRYTVLVPYYRQPEMLRVQIDAWNRAPEGVSFILVDDGSPEPALPIVARHASEALKSKLWLFRVLVDIPWNRGGARNLAAKEAVTRWIVQVDIDHVLQPASYRPLLDYTADPNRFYRFPRWRVGKADETRRKDKIPNDAEFGRIHEHVDSYLITRDLYWKVGGYDERYSGCLGGGGPFLRQLESKTRVAMLPDDIRMFVYTRDTVKDSSDWALDRSPSEYTFRRRQIERANDTASRPLMLNFPWERVL